MELTRNGWIATLHSYQNDGEKGDLWRSCYDLNPTQDECDKCGSYNVLANPEECVDSKSPKLIDYHRHISLDKKEPKVNPPFY